MKTLFIILGFFLLVLLTHASYAVQAAQAEMEAASAWIDADTPFISFTYGGEPSSALFSSWKFSSQADNGAFRRTWTCPKTGLEVRIEAFRFADSPAVEWVAYFKNNGTADTPIIEDIQALDKTFSSAGGDPIIHYAKGATCSLEDYRPMIRQLNKGGQMRIEPNGGRSSSDFMPFFNAALDAQSGLVIGLGWSGEWAAEFARSKSNGDMRIRCGMALTHLTLHPGEEIRTPLVAVLCYKNGDWVRGQNLLRQFVLAHHRPKTEQGPLTPLTLNGNWGGTKAEDHLKNIQAIIEHDLPIEYYWIDAEWFGKGKWHQTAGNWEVKKDLYPEGFKPLSDALHASGRKLLLWFEPERVCERTPWYEELQKWLLDVPKEQRRYNWGTSQAEPEWVRWESDRNQIVDNDRLFNLANPEARTFLTDFISARIDEFGLDCFRHDANIAPLEFWRAADAPDRQGITEIRWVEGLYAFWDALLERHPNLIIDNCASGGRRIDLESMSRSTPFWRTDYPAGSTVKQCHTYGISFFVPLNATGAVNPISDSAYDMRSTWSGSMAVGLFGAGDTPQSASNQARFDFGRTKAALEQYRNTREYFLGDYYPLTEYSQAEDAWIAWQFHQDGQNNGMVQVFRRPKSVCTTGTLVLKGLTPDKSYQVENLDTGERLKMTGQELMTTGLTVQMPEKPGSAVFLYRAE